MDFHNELKFLGLATRFPSLKDAPGVMPWNPLLLDEWAMEYPGNRQALHSVRYLLWRWNSRFQWECGSFALRNALTEWDLLHRRAFLDASTLDCQYAA